MSNTEDTVSYFGLYKYAKRADKIRTIMGTITAVFAGVAFSLYSNSTIYVYDNLLQYSLRKQNGTDVVQLADIIKVRQGYFLIYSGFTMLTIFSLTWTSTYLFSCSAANQIHTIRCLYLNRLLNLDLSWHDQNTTSDYVNDNAANMQKIQDGMGALASRFVFKISALSTSFITACSLNWLLSLIMFTLYPIYVICIVFVMKKMSKFAADESCKNGEATACAEETFSALKTVISFGGQSEQIRKYKHGLKSAMKFSTKRAFVGGILILISAVIYCLYASVGFWYGLKLVQRQESEPRLILACIFNAFNAYGDIASIGAYLETFAVARGAATKIFSVLNNNNNTCKNLFKTSKLDLQGNITFRNVSFSYSARPGIPVLKNFNLHIKSRETVGLVGKSGCGKSTCLDLLLRLYDPTNGTIEIDGLDLKQYDVSWLRNKIGIVRQEPVLFEGTIAENIRIGCLTATMDDVKRAAVTAHAHEFIESLPRGYLTLVGEKGTKVSGGQKQLIAIARALVRSPKILLFDEASSALDLKTESALQEALTSVTKQCTTIVISHRMSVLRKVDRILVISDGCVVEDHQYLKLAPNTYDFTYNPKDFEANPTLTEISKLDPIPNTSIEISNYKNKHRKSISQILLVFWKPFTLGILLTFVISALNPLDRHILGNLVDLMSQNYPEKAAIEMNWYITLNCVRRITNSVAQYLQNVLLGIVGEYFILKIKCWTFSSILKRDLGWFNLPQNTIGALGSKLSAQGTVIQGVFGLRIGLLCNSITGIIAGSVSALLTNWKLTLISIISAPFVGLAIFFEQFYLGKVENQIQAIQESTDQLAIEAISNIRTIASLDIISHFEERFESLSMCYRKSINRSLFIRGFVVGLTQCLHFMVDFVALNCGIWLSLNGQCSTYEFIIVSETLIYIEGCISEVIMFASHIKSATISLNSSLEFLNETLEDNNDLYIETEELAGNIEFKNVSFSYPTQPDIMTLESFNLSILKGKSVAIVGATGCGKTTIIKLLERFYEVSSGQIILGRKNISQVSYPILRRRMGLVLQEPELFGNTIRENIAYGDLDRSVSMTEIIQAAKKAHVHDFIKTLPLGYETSLGEKGTQLSGGQKQRIAIARVLIRNPDVLLLDEVTSALDFENEQIILKTLEEVRVGKTCIMNAHKLNIIKKFDLIVVIKSGRIAEVGRYEFLMNQKGIFYSMFEAE